jgi:tetratricopeptide (TPR) repeat protein
MPLFGGNKRPKLDGLTRDEEKRRDSLNPEVLARAGEGGVAAQAPAALAVLKERYEKEPNDFLWACLLGRQYMSMRRFAPAIEAFVAATQRDDKDVRGYYGAGIAYFEAAEGKLQRGPATTDDIAPEDMTVDNLYHESIRHFKRALELTNDKDERDQLRSAISVVEKAVAKKAGRL